MRQGMQADDIQTVCYYDRDYYFGQKHITNKYGIL